MTPDPLLVWRPEFPILEHTRYLISNSLGAMPRAATRALAEYAEAWSTRGVRAWADSWWDMSISVGDEIAPLLTAHAGSVSMLPNVTIAAAVVLSSLDYAGGSRRRIVTVDGEFPSIRYVCAALGGRLGAEIVTVVVDYRPGVGIRMSPHFYTGDDELDAAFAAIDEIRETGVWRRWVDRPAVVT